MREWLQDTIKVLSVTELSFPFKLAATVFLMCCSYSICKNELADLSSISLMEMMALPPSGDGFEFLGSLMKEKRSQYAMHVSNYLMCTVYVYVSYNYSYVFLQ